MRSLGRRLLGIPLFYKILIANATIVVLGAVGGTFALRAADLAPGRGLSPEMLGALLAVGGLVVSVLVNAAILRLALLPLHQLERTAACVQRGEMDARVPPSPLADRQLERLTGTFNAMLDNLEGFQQRLRDVAAHALNAAEEERKRIARELHDETAQTLAALLIRLRLARSLDDSEARDRLLQEMREEIGQALEGVRRFARGLRPPALDELGLVPALEAHVRALSDSVQLPVRMESEPLDGLLSRSCELVLYRVVQEALSNSLRHAQADLVTIRLGRDDDVVFAEVADDGSGFDVERTVADDRQGLGLFGMRERAAYAGGRVQIHSRPGEGTTVRAEIPLERTAPTA